LKPTRFKFRYVNEITGVFLFTALLLIVGGAVMSERSQHWFSKKFTFDLLLPEKGTLGLARGNGVYVLGIEAGMVEDIRVGEDGRIEAQVRIRADFQRFVRQDSVATIKKTFGVAGDSFVEITQGTGAPLSEVDPVLVCLASDELPGMMEKLLDEVRREIVPVLQKSGEALDAWSSLAHGVNQTQGDLRQLIARLDGLVTGLEQGRGTAGRLLTSDSLSKDLEQALAEARELIATGTASLEQFHAGMSNFREGTARFPEIGDAVAAETQELAGLVLQTQKTVYELQRLVEGLQRHWLVRKYIDSAEDIGARIPPSQLREGRP